MKIISVDVNDYDRFPENKAPRSGYVKFSDGKEYSFTVYRDQPGFWEAHIAFHSSKVMHADSTMRYRQKFTFRSKKREELLDAWLKENG